MTKLEYFRFILLDYPRIVRQPEADSIFSLYGDKSAPGYSDVAVKEVYVDPDYRRDWAWMLLPIRSGFPAAESPFAGIVAHAETGNLAPFTVTYNGGWNRNGAAGGASRSRSAGI
jgi:hypothetical protein